jgi:hypothetical protein
MNIHRLYRPFMRYFRTKRMQLFCRLFGLTERPTVQQCDNFLREIRLLDEIEMRQIFPDVKIVRERVLVFTKSLIAIKI